MKITEDVRKYAAEKALKRGMEEIHRERQRALREGVTSIR